jgi:hypothetical protein
MSFTDVAQVPRRTCPPAEGRAGSRSKMRSPSARVSRRERWGQIDNISCSAKRRRALESIYALVIASLIVPAVALALMAGRALAAEPEWPDLKPLWDFFDMLDRSWVGMTLKNYDPNGWNGVWPKGGTVWPKNETKSETKSGMVIYREPGGVIKEHIERWQELARSGTDVEILGPCYSACTLIVAYVPKERLCFGAFATLQFHLARNPKTGKPSLDASLWMLKQYPPEVYDWIMERGGVDSMTIPTFMELRAPSLWRMGYRQCKRDQ